MTFAEFMDIALYHQPLGFYQKAEPFGKEGSFYTSVNASRAFGVNIARSIVTCVDELHLVPAICEMGAGTGMLASDLLGYLRSEEPDFYGAMTYTIIEKSDRLIQRQKEMLKEHGDRVRWIPFEELKGFKGVFFSNELVDAFPVHRVINIDGSLYELFVIDHEGQMTFMPGDFSTQELPQYLERMNIRLVPKQMADINLDATRWITALADKIEQGVVITIDYGFSADKLFTPMRMDGTVTCYHKHTQNNNFFDNIGDQDITAFVDFSALMQWGQDAGLTTLYYEPQWMYMIKSGILEDVAAAEDDLKRASIKSLIMPEGGFGTTFQVLMQAKNVTPPEGFHYLKSSADIFTQMAARIASS